MNKELAILVREIQVTDIDYLADYWFNAKPEHFRKMGANKDKLPKKSVFKQMLAKQIKTPVESKQSYALIWEINGQPIGHSNINNIVFEQEATMHLHIWNPHYRMKGIGTELVRQSLPFYFNAMKLKKLICEPYALNLAPNKTLEKVGFKFIKKYTTIPGSLNFEQQVNRWELSKEQFNSVAAALHRDSH